MLRRGSVKVLEKTVILSPNKCVQRLAVYRGKAPFGPSLRMDYSLLTTHYLPLTAFGEKL